MGDPVFFGELFRILGDNGPGCRDLVTDTRQLLLSIDKLCELERKKKRSADAHIDGTTKIMALTFEPHS